MLVHVFHTYGVATISRLRKMIVSFAKEPYKRDDILQKRPIILRTQLTVATPYHTLESIHYTYTTHLIHIPHTPMNIYLRDSDTYTTHLNIPHTPDTYGVALVSRIDKMIGLFCKRAL